MKSLTQIISRDKQTRKSSLGATMLEFSFAFSLLMLFLFGFIEISYFLFAKSMAALALEDQLRSAALSTPPCGGLESIDANNLASNIENRINSSGPFHVRVEAGPDALWLSSGRLSATDIFLDRSQLIQAKFRVTGSCMFCVGGAFSAFSLTSSQIVKKDLQC